ncbi:hypothetical protein [Tolypothrix sp. PCC 7601]|uniref:hypothetical protein n=1 Tax=Tolypothrix sp. PCC 7601 TaxID=1188 RepID=UPI0021E0D9ED|nr:hypothetical protein [Tolypothrix sp. PCC 7601]UYD38982.1 hypothetical protein HG267_41425 [Tolypothrix sp. PCC 7601]
MAIETFKVKSKIAVTLDIDSNNTVIPLFTYIPYAKSGYRVISEYLEIENLKLTTWITSLPAVEFPTFSIEASESEQLLQALNVEWGSDRIQLNVMLQINSEDWQKISAYSLLNRSPYPYGEYDLGNHNLGDNSMLGLQIYDVGYGLLAGSDKVSAYGDLIRTIALEELSDDSVKIANTINTTASIIINSNANRKGLIIFNSSTKDIYIDTVSTVSVTSYIIHLSPGGYYESPLPIYKGAYYAVITSGSTAIDIREFI